MVALYFFIVEVNNRLGWKKEFGITPRECMDALNIGSYNTYKKNFDKLIEYGFIEIVKKSTNQYQSNIIALSKFDKALDEPVDKALDKAMTKHLRHSINNKTINKETNKPIGYDNFSFEFLDENFQVCFFSWLEYKQQRREKYKTQKSLELCYNQMVDKSGNDPKTAMSMINQSMANNWAGLFEISDIGKKPNQTKLQPKNDTERQELLDRFKSNTEI